MKTKLLVLVMLISVSGVYAQKLVNSLMNGGFENGTIATWRALEVRGGAIYMFEEGSEALGGVNVTDDSNNGDYAAEVTFAVSDDMNDIVFDQIHQIEGGKDYIYVVSAYAKAGAARLRPHCTVFNADDGMVLDVALDDATWVLGDFYGEYVWVLPTMPDDATYFNLGFRLMGAVEGRWPDTDVTFMVDDVQLWEGSVGTDMFALTTSMTGTGSGEVVLSPLSPTADGNYWVSTQVSATIIPVGTDVFVAWTGDNIVGTDTTTASVIMDQDQSISAEVNLFVGVEDMVNATSSLTNYPNPFNSSTTISYTLNANSNVTLSVYDVTGSLVSVLVSQYQSSGEHTVIWNGTSSAGNSLNQGIYFGRLDIANGKSQNIKILLNK